MVDRDSSDYLLAEVFGLAKGSKRGRGQHQGVEGGEIRDVVQDTEVEFWKFVKVRLVEAYEDFSGWEDIPVARDSRLGAIDRIWGGYFWIFFLRRSLGVPVDEVETFK